MRLALLMSGGDAPGMNAVLRGVQLAAQAEGHQLEAIDGGFQGLLAGRFLPFPSMGRTDAARGGSLVSTGRCAGFDTPPVQQDAASILKEHGVQGLLVAGGNGSLTGASTLARLGVPTVGIPVTVDGDVFSVHEAVGFATAAQELTRQICALHSTADAYGGRIFLLETLGARRGGLALTAGLAAGADLVLLPERDPSPEAVARKTERIWREKGSAVLVMCEGAHPDWKNGDQNFGQRYGGAIEARLGVRTRYTTAGYGLRGLAPVHADMLLGTACGHLAVKALSQGARSGIAGVRGGEMGLHSLNPDAPGRDWSNLWQLAAEQNILVE